jgi:hypothetical protein
MAQTTIYDLLEATLKSMPLPASTNDVYLKLVKNGPYSHMNPNEARKIISSKLCKLRTKGLLVSHNRDDGRMMWDFKQPIKTVTKPNTIEQQPIIVHTINNKPADNTYVLHVLFSEISAAFAKAAHGLISHDK